MKKLMAMLLALTMMLGCGAAMGETLIHGIDPDYPPFSYRGDDGEFTGFDVEIAKAVCELLGWDYEIFELNWDSKLIQLSSYDCDVIWSGMTIVDTMKEQGYVISAPYYDNTQVLVVKKDSGIASSEDLAGKVVAVQAGTSGDILLNGDLAELTATFAELTRCESFNVCFAELMGGAADAVFVDLPNANDYLAKHDADGTLEILSETLGSEQYGMAFRPGDEELCATIEGAVAQLVENGTYAEIASKYPAELVENLIFLRGE